MARTDNLYELPKNLPIPMDDGACDHLVNIRLPSVPLKSTSGDVVDLASFTGTTIVYCYPRTGQPDRNPPKGWNEIPGARGCTPQTCAYRDHYLEFQALGVRVFGLSAQDTEYQKEAVERLCLPFDLLSDSSLAFTKVVGLPTFEVESMTLLKRVTLVINSGKIIKVFYPIFPPDGNAQEVLTWLSHDRLVV